MTHGTRSTLQDFRQQKADETVRTRSLIAVYTDANPWVAWMRRHAPQLVVLTPNELRRYMHSNSWPGPPDWELRAA